MQGGSGACEVGQVCEMWVWRMQCRSGECNAWLMLLCGSTARPMVQGCEAGPAGVVGVQVGLQCGSGYIRDGSDKPDMGPVRAMGVQRMPWALVQQYGSGVCRGGLAHAMRVRCGPDA